ncbi:TPA: DUF3037 domain-containing protein [Pseudomonas putida]
MYTFQYSIIKYMPDPMRGEVVNVGLVVFTNDKLDVRTLNTSAKVRIIDGVSDLTDIDSVKDSIEALGSIASSTEQAIEFFKTFKGSTTYLTDPAIFILDDINQYEGRIRSLFNQLVKPFASKEKTHRNSRINTYIKQTFERMDILGKDVDDISRHKVIYNYPLNNKTGFSADFLLKNGKFHITEAIDFNVNDATAKFKETTMKVMTFMEGRKHLGEDSARYFVYSANSSREKDFIPHLNLAEEYSDKIFNLESKVEKQEYFSLMSTLVGSTLGQVH